jgi:hypothetical protein
VRRFWVASHRSLVIALYPPCPFPHWAPCHRYRRSTCNPPHKQLLVGLEVGGVLSSVVCHSFVVLCCSFVVVHRLSYIVRSLSSIVCCTLFVPRLFLIVHRLLYVVHSLFVPCRSSSVVRHSFVIVHRLSYIIRSLSSVVHQLASIIPTYPPCEQWLAVAGVGADM